MPSLQDRFPDMRSHLLLFTVAREVGSDPRSVAAALARALRLPISVRTLASAATVSGLLLVLLLSGRAWATDPADRPSEPSREFEAAYDLGRQLYRWRDTVGAVEILTEAMWANAIFEWVFDSRSLFGVRRLVAAFFFGLGDKTSRFAARNG
jgi:hypothetical protein